MNLCIRKKRKNGDAKKIRLDNNAKADFNRPCCHDNTYCENIWAHMNNILHQFPYHSPDK